MKCFECYTKIHKNEKVKCECLYCTNNDLYLCINCYTRSLIDCYEEGLNKVVSYTHLTYLIDTESDDECDLQYENFEDNLNCLSLSLVKKLKGL